VAPGLIEGLFSKKSHEISNHLGSGPCRISAFFVRLPLFP
jgi:hypothetical protein